MLLIVCSFELSIVVTVLRGLFYGAHSSSFIILSRRAHSDFWKLWGGSSDTIRGHECLLLTRVRTKIHTT
jgi:hypothetical protein